MHAHDDFISFLVSNLFMVVSRCLPHFEVLKMLMEIIDRFPFSYYIRNILKSRISVSTGVMRVTLLLLRRPTGAYPSAHPSNDRVPRTPKRSSLYRVTRERTKRASAGP